MTSGDPTGGYQCIWSNLKENPKCPHGPMLLFGRKVGEDYKRFYACSACRDRKLCKYYADYGTKQTKQQRQTLETDKKTILPRYDSQKMFIRFNEMMAENPARRIYCHDCSRLSFVSEKHKHRGHDLLENLTDHQMHHPTEILKPLDNPKKEAQYLFSEQSTKTIAETLVVLGAKNVLCIGAPRIHEYLINNFEDKVSSLLLDFDGRFHNFFGPLNFCWYNLFNNHFFHDDSESVLRDFLVQNGGKNTYIICDPPFGGRVEPISQTLKTIADLHRKLNKLEVETDGLKTIFISPYFMEPILKEKSNPPRISGGLKELRMCDYKVDYDNHPLFAKSQERKIGSPVRIFTDVDLDLIKLPESEGYKYCKRCRKWISGENKHCKICKNCTSKDGRRYRHCKACVRCVKPTWKHCKKCDRCALENHKCGEAPKITGQCFKCNEFGHVEKFCPSTNGKDITASDSHLSDGSDDLVKSKNKNKNKKRKIENHEGIIIGEKKARFEIDDKESSSSSSSRIVKKEKPQKGKLKLVKKKGIKFNEPSKLKTKLKNQKLIDSVTTIVSPKGVKNFVKTKSTKNMIQLTRNVGNVVKEKNKEKKLSKSINNDKIKTIASKKTAKNSHSVLSKKGMKKNKGKTKQE